MDFPYQLEVSPDKMRAWIKPAGNHAQPVTEREIEEWLLFSSIKYGLKVEIKSQLLNAEHIVFPFMIAEGKFPVNGHDGQLRLEFLKETEKQVQPFNFKNIVDIPSVSTGQKIATVSHPTFGHFGLDVYGNKVIPKPGREAHYKLGQNVIEHESSIYSTMDGQICIIGHTLQVNPVYRVTGDLSMEVGNIDFVGNVDIEGNVPAGYSISCGGDLKVYGMIEGSNIDVGGSIYVHGGITGEKNCCIRSGGNLQALYLNYANVITSGDVNIHTAILHSSVTSMQSVSCKKGHMIGGIVRAGKRVELQDAGNIHYTRTEIHIGNKKSIEMKKKELDSRCQKIDKTITKLSYISVILEEKVKTSNAKKDILLLDKQRKTKDLLVEQLKKLKQERFILDYEMQVDEELIIYGSCYPNLYIKMGKYNKIVNQIYQSVRFTDKGNDISVVPL